MSGPISRLPSPVFYASRPASPPPERPAGEAYPFSPQQTPAACQPDMSVHGKNQQQKASERGKARVERALADMKAQQNAAMAALSVENPADTNKAVIVNEQAMAWTRALVEQAPITPAPGNNHDASEGEHDRTGVEEFDHETTIAIQDAQAMRPYLSEAQTRLAALENPPATPGQCKELCEQLEHYMNDPGSYGICGRDGRYLELQTQTFRAYLDALMEMTAVSPEALPGIPNATPQELANEGHRGVVIDPQALENMLAALGSR